MSRQPFASSHSPLAMQTPLQSGPRTIGTNRNLDQAGFSMRIHPIEIITGLHVIAKQWVPAHAESSSRQK